MDEIGGAAAEQQVQIDGQQRHLQHQKRWSRCQKKSGCA